MEEKTVAAGSIIDCYADCQCKKGILATKPSYCNMNRCYVPDGEPSNDYNECENGWNGSACGS